MNTTVNYMELNSILKSTQILNLDTSKLEYIHSCFKIYIKNKIRYIKVKKECLKYIEKNPKIKAGQSIIKGTRITTRNIFSEIENYDWSADTSDGQGFLIYIKEQYPSITNDEQILYALIYELNKISLLKGFLKR